MRVAPQNHCPQMMGQPMMHHPPSQFPHIQPLSHQLPQFMQPPQQQHQQSMQQAPHNQMMVNGAPQAPPGMVPRKVIENYSYCLTDELGSGYSSKVYKGRDERTGETVAIQVIDMKMVNNEVQSFLLKNEINVLKKLDNINCLQMYDVFQTNNNTYIISEICNQGDLKELLAKYGHLSEKQAVKILVHLINGFQEITQQHIIHRDIKPANILLKDGIPKIADFGFAQDLDAAPCRVYYNVGSPIYMCLQSLQQNQYSYKSDIWSIGILYFELLFGVTPWTANQERDLIDRISRVPLTFPSTIRVTEDSKDFIRKCLSLDENKRIGPKDLELHPLIQKATQEYLEEKRKKSEEDLMIPSHPNSTSSANNSLDKFVGVRGNLGGLPEPQQPSLTFNNQSFKTTDDIQNNIPTNNSNVGILNNRSNTTYGNSTNNSNNNNSNSNNTSAMKSQNELQPSNNIMMNKNSNMVQQNNLQTVQPTKKLFSSPQQNDQYTNFSEKENNFPFLQKDIMTPHLNLFGQENQKTRGLGVNLNESERPTNNYDVLEFAFNNKYPGGLGGYGGSFANESSKQGISSVNTNNTTSNSTVSGIGMGLNTGSTIPREDSYSISKDLIQENDRIILAQINFCRYLYRLGKLIEENSIFQTNFLKERLQFFIMKNIMVKISKLKEMVDNSANPLLLREWSSYCLTDSFKQFASVINEYFIKYSNYLKFHWENVFTLSGIKEELATDQQFDAVFDLNFIEFESFYIILQSFLRFSIREMNTIIKNQINEDGEYLPSQIEGAIVLLDYLVTYFQLSSLILDYFGNHSLFAQASKIEQIADGNPVKLSKTHYVQIQNQIQSLEI